MLITLFTDASYNSTLRRATWAAWFKSEGETWRFAGPVRGEVTNSADGELAAIGNGLYYIIQNLAPPGGSLIIAQTDSLEAIHAIRKGAHPRGYCQKAVEKIYSMISGRNLVLETRHVKAHTGTNSPRSAVNTWCHNACRKEMGKLIAQVNLPTKEHLDV